MVDRSGCAISRRSRNSCSSLSKWNARPLPGSYTWARAAPSARRPAACAGAARGVRAPGPRTRRRPGPAAAGRASGRGTAGPPPPPAPCARRPPPAPRGGSRSCRRSWRTHRRRRRARPHPGPWRTCAPGPSDRAPRMHTESIMRSLVPRHRTLPSTAKSEEASGPKGLLGASVCPGQCRSPQARLALPRVCVLTCACRRANTPLLGSSRECASARAARPPPPAAPGAPRCCPASAWFVQQGGGPLANLGGWEAEHWHVRAERLTKGARPLLRPAPVLPRPGALRAASALCRAMLPLCRVLDAPTILLLSRCTFEYGFARLPRRPRLGGEPRVS